MDLTTTLTQIIALNVDDRIRLVQAIWDSLSLESVQIPLTEAQRQEIARRLLDYESNPTAVVSWVDVKAQAILRLNG